jgi:hypothetical protein
MTALAPKFRVCALLLQDQETGEKEKGRGGEREKRRNKASRSLIFVI